MQIVGKMEPSYAPFTCGTPSVCVSSTRYARLHSKKEYHTLIVATAEKVNLKLEDAQDLMFKKTAYAMAGFF